jgi:hypothetical protein
VSINAGRKRDTLTTSDVVSSGKATIRFVFADDGGRLDSGGAGTIVFNGKKVAEGRIERAQPVAYSADEGADVGTNETTDSTARSRR